MARLTQHWHRFEVTGSGMFPHDMLRYDQCFPLHQGDYRALQEPLEETSILVLGHWGPSSWTPTNDRWRSFHWAVTHHEVMK